MNLPAVLEIKRTLAGREKRFSCQRLDGGGEGDRRWLVVLFVSPAPMHVHGIDLPAGTVTFGHFWTDRPYNAYHWMTASGQTVGVYFNLSDRTRIDDGQLEWRDLTVDILTTPDGRVEVLDRDELPPELDPALRRQIDDGQAALLASLPGVLAEIAARSGALAPAVFGAVRP